MPFQEELSTIAQLYELQLKRREDRYLVAHSRNSAVIRRQVDIFRRCSKYLSSATVFLDWGCRQGVDACLMRMELGDRVQIHGCDVDSDRYEVFFDFSGLDYRQLQHPYLLPYQDDMFDVVMASGVLEHVPFDSESLKELYRVIRPDGLLVITMLPNRFSYTECLNRTLHNPHHLRLYSRKEILRLLLHNGFLPLESGYHQLIPTLSSPKGGIFDIGLMSQFIELLWPLNKLLERVSVVNLLSTNIFVVAKKVVAFHG